MALPQSVAGPPYGQRRSNLGGTDASEYAQEHRRTQVFGRRALHVPNRVHSMLSIRVLSVISVALIAAVALLRSRTATEPVEHAAPFRPSLHAAPPDDVAALNATAPRRVPEGLESAVLPDDRPAVVLFLKAGCGCSEGFARMFTSIEPHLRLRASCLAVIEAADGEAAPFVQATGLGTPYLVQDDASLAAEWGVKKAGCVALVRPDRTVEAIWPGISRQGFRDIAGRLGAPESLPPKILNDLPGAATAGCPLLSSALSLSNGVSQ